MPDYKQEVLKVETKDTTIYIAPVLLGFRNDKTGILDVLAELSPSAVAISISPAELLAMKEVLEDITKRKLAEDIEPSNYDLIYMRGMGSFGEVYIPPPCWTELIKACAKSGVDISALDMTEDEYAKVFIEHVKTLDLIRHSFRIKRYANKTFKHETPEEFADALDKSVTSLRGYGRLEAKREAHMAKRALELASGKKSLLAAVEYSRAKNVHAALLRMIEAKGREKEQ